MRDLKFFLSCCRIAALPFTIPMLLAPSALAQAELQVGYGIFDLQQGSPSPAASALFRLTNPDGIVVTEAGVGAVAAIREGRIFVQQDSQTSTGFALVNLSEQPEEVTLTLRDGLGQTVAESVLVLAAGEHLPRFVNELFGGLPPVFLGSLSFEAGSPDGQLAAVTIRQGSNSFGEPLLTTLPVTDIGGAQPAGALQASLVFPQIGAGVGLSTQIALISRSSQAVQGTIRLFDSMGNPLALERDGALQSEFGFQISGDGVFFTELTSSEAARAGYAVVEVEAGDLLPAGSAIFRFIDQQGQAISEAGVGAVPATIRSRIVVDSTQTRTGVALASPSNAANLLDFDLLDPNGTFIATAERQLPPHGHLAIFADELFQLEEGFRGMLEIRSQLPAAVITLNLTINQRQQPVLTTLPIADLNAPLGAERLILPQMGFGISLAGDFSTQILFLSSDPNEVSAGQMTFRTGSGTPWDLGELPNDFGFAVGAGESGRISLLSAPPPTVIQRGSSGSIFIGPAGGTISVQDGQGTQANLQIPPNALSEPVLVTLTLLQAPPRRTFSRSLFPGILLEPEGLILNQPAQLEIRLADPVVRPELSRLFWLASPSQVRALGNQRFLPDSIQGEMSHFSAFTWEGLTLSDAVFYADLIIGLDPEQRAELGFPPLDEAILEFLVTLADVDSLLELQKLQEALGADDLVANEVILGLLEQGALRFLDQPAPADPCGLYHSFLRKFAGTVQLLDDAVIDQLFQQRIEGIDEQCIGVDLTGSWLVQGFDEAESCRIVSGCQSNDCQWVEEEEDSVVEVNVVQQGSSFSVTFPDFPEVGTLNGRLQATGNSVEPYFFTVSTDSASTLDCMIFFESQGLGIGFGAPLCNANSCEPISCQEEDTVTANVSADGQSFLGIEFWDFLATVLETPAQGPSVLLDYRCQGTAQVAGSKQE